MEKRSGRQEGKPSQKKPSYAHRVYEILQAKGAILAFSDGINGWHDTGDYRVVEAFFQTFEYSPQSAFGQFIQLTIAEYRYAERLGKYIQKASKDSISKSYIKVKQTTLREIRRVRKEIAVEIFDEKHEEYTLKTRQIFTRPTRRMSDPTYATMVTELVSDVKQHFPLTSQ